MRNAIREFRSARRRLETRNTPMATALERILEINIVFVHVPKCGGKSVVKEVYGLGEHDWFGHAGIGFYRGLLGPKRFRAAFKFAFLRDPVARCFSGFEFRQRGGFSLPTDKQLQAEFEGLTFNDFVLSGKLTEFARKDVVFQPQAPLFFLPSGEFGLDRICRFENFDEEIRNLPIERKNCAVTHINAGPKASAPEFAAEVREMIEHIYAEDCKFIARLDT
ncbi:MAG: sulfotransferase family 2 domain-containing protein [Pseudomonadota bacterium]